jgi:hypothetical protein
LLGLSLSKNAPIENMPARIAIQAGKGGGHDKAIENIIVWLDITAPRGWWQHVATYRSPEDGEDGFMPSGITINSQSTMYTLTKRPLAQDDFEMPILQATLDHLNQLIADGDRAAAQNELPEGFLQRRIVCTNYAVLYRMIFQRSHHGKREWRVFCDSVLEQAQHPELLKDKR